MTLNVGCTTYSSRICCEVLKSSWIVPLTTIAILKQTTFSNYKSFYVDFINGVDHKMHAHFLQFQEKILVKNDIRIRKKKRSLIYIK